jgi:uncharacterized RDD family membrane protein YckC
MQTIRITTTQNIDIDYEVAGLGERIVAYIIDMAIFIVVIIATFIVIATVGSLQNGGGVITNGLILIIYAVLFVFYDLICETAMNGQSVGKRVMKIKVISLDGSRPRFGQYLLRWLFRIIDFPLTSYACGLICIAVSDKSQRVGDMVAGTTLIKTNPRTKMNNIAFKPAEDNYQPVFAEAARLHDKDIELINEVINNYMKSRNSMLVYNMANRIKELLAVTPPPGMNDMLFLQTIIKDYSHIIADADELYKPVKPLVDVYQPVFAAAANLGNKDIELINEVLNDYTKNGNSVLIYNMARRVKEVWDITPPAEMNDMVFLQTLVKDHGHYTKTQADIL